MFVLVLSIEGKNLNVYLIFNTKSHFQ